MFSKNLETSILESLVNVLLSLVHFPVVFQHVLIDNDDDVDYLFCTLLFHVPNLVTIYVTQKQCWQILENINQSQYPHILDICQNRLIRLQWQNMTRKSYQAVSKDVQNMWTLTLINVF